MLKKLYSLIKEWDERRFVEKVRNFHQRVLDAFGAFGINVGPVPIIRVTQDELKSIEALERYALDMAYNPEFYVRGIYSDLTDAILLDRSTWKWEKSVTIDHVLAHEYAHRLFRRFMSAVEKKEEDIKNPNLDRLTLPGAVEEVNPLEKLKRYVESLQMKRRTVDDRRRLEFDIYFEEMFAESVALYLTGQVNGDRRWLDYSQTHQGVVLGQDRQFTRRLEEALYNTFFERLFSHGLRHVAIELPFLYQVARHTMEKRYQKSLPEATPK